MTKRELIVSEQFGDKDDFTAQSIRLRRFLEYYNDCSNKCKLTKRPELMTVGDSRKKSGLEKHGITVKSDKESEAYLNWRNVEASSFGSDTILLRPNPTASALFEEIIRIGQIRRGELDPLSKISEVLSEISAKEKLIRNKKAYGITDIEDKKTKRQLNEYKEQLGNLEKEANNNEL